MNEETLVTTGTESFDLKKEINTTESSGVKLTIEEEVKGIELEDRFSEKLRVEKNPIIRFYNKVNKYLLSKSGIKTKEKADFFHLLSVMINAGIPMVRALRSLSGQLKKSPQMQLVVENLADKIESGTSLSRGMQDHFDVFTEAEVGMVQAGEASGQLSEIMQNLATDAEKSHMIKAKVRSALMYPAVIFSLLIVVVAGMMIFVVPKLTELFATMGGDLPLITKIVVGVSDFFVNYWVNLLVVLFGLGLFFFFFKKTAYGSFALDKVKLRLPLVGGLLTKGYLARFARSLSNLVDSNVSIVRSMEITANSIGNQVYKKRLLMAMEDIKQGIPLAENLNESDLFPPMLVNMVEVGEQTAQLDTILAKVAKFYEDEVDTAVSGFSKILEPVILVIIGGTVGTVVAAIMIPIMKLSNLSGIG